MVRPPLESHDIFRKVKENFEATGLRRSRCMRRGHIHCGQTPSDRVLHNGNVTTKTIHIQMGTMNDNRREYAP